MSFDINLMLNDSDVNVIGKKLNTLSTVSGTLKEQTSILNPVVKISGTIPTNCNYMYIPTFARYYFVSDIRSITANIFEISGHVDVLETYKEGIKNNTALVARNESRWNLYLDDGSFKSYQNEKTQIKVFSGGFTTENFILAVAGS